MNRSLIRRAAVLVAAAGLGALALESPAAAVVPVWPAGGHIPSCDAVTLVPYSPTYYAYDYQDTTLPTIDSMRWAGGKTAVVVGPAGRKALLVTKAHDSCSGVGAVNLFVVFQPAVGSLSSTSVPLTPTPADGNYFNVTLKMGGMVDPGDAGYYRFAGADVIDRWSEFGLDANYRFIDGSSTDRGGSGVFRAMDGQQLWVLRQTKLTASVSRSQVSRGAKVTVRVSADVAAAPGPWADLAGAKVALQRKTASGWTTVTTLTANSSGVAAVKQTLRRTTTYRFAVKTSKAKYFGGSNSKNVTVRVG